MSGEMFRVLCLPARVLRFSQEPDSDVDHNRCLPIFLNLFPHAMKKDIECTLFAIDQIDSIGVVIVDNGFVNFANKCSLLMLNVGDSVVGQSVSVMFHQLFNKNTSFVEMLNEHLETQKHCTCSVRDISSRVLYQVKLSIFSAKSVCCYFTISTVDVDSRDYCQ
jgi:hypothetical protein